MTETVRDYAKRLALEALAQCYSTKQTGNPAFDPREDRAAARRGEEYKVERYRPRRMDEMVEDSCMVVLHDRDDDDGYGSYIRALTYREVVDAIVDDLVEHGVIRPADIPLPTADILPIGNDGLTQPERDEAERRWNEGPARRHGVSVANDRFVGVDDAT